VGPRLIRALVRVLLAVFYRRIDVSGLEHVPATEPLIVAANHQNGLIDPMLLLASVPRELRPLAKAGLFRHPLIAPFLRLAGALPLHRRQDAGSDMASNAQTFRAVGEALGRREAIVIFPEGVSQPEPTLMTLRTGAARLLLEAEGAGTPPVT
jgi:glycerol-3-phosphate O-acyltransferase/dihydroxyacetone phosphate acyltransferase